MFDIRTFYQDYGIDYVEGGHPHKHARHGWVNCSCPLCSGSPGYHLGFSEQSGQFVCYRCGFHPVIEVVKAFTGLPWKEAKSIVKYYGGGKRRIRYEKTAKEKDIDVEFPSETLDKFSKRHKKYLENRNFDPDHLINMWDLRATGKSGGYANRIIAPIYYRNTLMSYQGRDVTNSHFAKYKACAVENERRHHKHCLYGIDLAVGGSCVVVEGATDVWRLGPGAVGTFGIKFTCAQVLLLHHHFDRIFVLFDETDPESEKKGDELAMELAMMGKQAERIETGLGCDPGDLSEEDAGYVMRELLIH